MAMCSCNDRDREQLHLERRQALRDRQRAAVISGRSVRSVIETEVESETSQCPRMTCVQMTPRLKTHGGSNTSDVYDRLNQGGSAIQKIDKEKPPQVQITKITSIESTKKTSSKESDEEYPDEREKLSAEKDLNSVSSS
uniref:Uncharacterized protein n=1 Tax=Caenorhabditis japonica TaxID=281687 RepID=A0A8R1E209_CAEJA